MSLSINIRSTKLPEATDFYNFFDRSVVADNNKSYFIYADGSKDEALIYKIEDIPNFQIRLDDVVHLILGDSVKEFNVDHISQFSNLEALTIGSFIDLDDGLFVDCEKLVQINAEAYSVEYFNNTKLFEKQNAVYNNRPSIVIKCNDGYVDIVFNHTIVQPVDSTHYVLSNEYQRIYLHADDKPFNLSASMAENGIKCDPSKIIDVKVNPATTTLSSIPQGSTLHTNGFGWTDYIGPFDRINASNFSLPAHIECLPENSFRKSSISSIEFADDSKLSHIRMRAFDSCQQLISVDIPNSVNRIDAEAFAHCTKLQYAHIPNRVDFGKNNVGYDSYGLHNRIFDGCSSLSSIRLDKYTIEDLTSNGFEKNPITYMKASIDVGKPCGSLFGYSLNHDVLMYLSNDVVLIHPEKEFIRGSFDSGIYEAKYKHDADIKTKFIRRDSAQGLNDYQYLIFGELNAIDVVNRKNLGEVQIGYGVTKIGDYCFSDVNTLTTVNNKFSTCIEFGDHAFENCTSLVQIDGKCPTTIGKACFKNCSQLIQINELSNFYTIGDEAFMGCTNLQGLNSIIDVNGLYGFGRRSLYGCTNIDIEQLKEFIRNNSYYSATELKNLIVDKEIFGPVNNNPLFMQYLQTTGESSIVFENLYGSLTLNYNIMPEYKQIEINGVYYWAQISIGTCEVVVTDLMEENEII